MTTVHPPLLQDVFEFLWTNNVIVTKLLLLLVEVVLLLIAGIPVEGKSSECLICMKYRIIILIIIISLGQLFYCILQTHHACTHARVDTRTRAHACARTHTRTRAHARANIRAHTAVAAVTVRRIGYRYLSAPSCDRQLRRHS